MYVEVMHGNFRFEMYLMWFRKVNYRRLMDKIIKISQIIKVFTLKSQKSISLYEASNYHPTQLHISKVNKFITFHF